MNIRLSVALAALGVALTAVYATAQMTILGAGSSGGCSGLFVPSQLASSQYQFVLDGSTVAWSGSNFGTTANAGSMGGNIVAGTGTVVKGTQLNALDTVAFSGSNSLKIVSKNWSGDVYIFGVFAMPANTWTLASQGWGTGTTGWLVYPRTTAGGTSGGVTYGAGDLLGMPSGFNIGSGGQPDLVATTPIADTSQHLHSYQMGTTNSYRKDGSAVTPSSSQTGAIASLTAVDVLFGSDGSAFGAYTAAYLLGGNPPSAGNIQKLEGWAATRFNLRANLPAGHPYKSSAPPC